MITAAAALLPTTERRGIAEYRQHGGYRSLADATGDPAAAREILLRCTLTGLGGAHFPFPSKLALSLAAPGPRCVVGNCAEDEPGSRKDRTLLELNPHLVLEGALIAARMLEADTVYLYVSESLTEARASLDAAISELAADGDGAAGYVAGIRIVVWTAPTAYVAGEATAAVRAIDGDEAKPKSQPPYPTERGVQGRPTLVSNCETLANLPRLIGAPADSVSGAMTRLATVTGDVNRPGVYEIVPEETTFGDLIAIAGGMTSAAGALKAIQPGGPSSAYLTADAAGVLLTNDAIRAAGSQPGCLAVNVIGESRCMVTEAEKVTAFFAREQCGQCPACRMKTQAYSKVMQQVASGHGSWQMIESLSAVEEFVSDMTTRCSLISMPTPPVSSAVRLFRTDFAALIDRSDG